MIDIRIDCDEYKTGIVECVHNKDLKIELLEEEVARLKKEMVDIGMGGENKWTKPMKAIKILWGEVRSK